MSEQQMSERQIELAAVLDLRAAAPLVNELRAARGADVAISAANVERMGAQCAQALLSAAKTWTADGHRLRIASPSEAFTRALRLLGIDLPHSKECEENECL